MTEAFRTAQFRAAPHRRWFDPPPPGPQHGEGGRPHVMLAIPYDRAILGTAVQSLCYSLLDPEVRVTPLLAPGAVIHLQRDAMVRQALADPTIDYLCMVDSDQVWAPLVLRRLVSWGAPVVAPLIVQRMGDAIPVAYRQTPPDESGWRRYSPLLSEIAVYLRRYNPDRWEQDAGQTCVLPLKQDFSHSNMSGIPQDLLEGLEDPLLPCDAVGGGMVCVRRDVLEALEPHPKMGLYFDFDEGGEDFSFCRRITKAGWGGCEPGPRGHGIYLDRGCLVGHVVSGAKGATDLMEFMARVDDEAEEKRRETEQLPSASELVEELRRRAERFDRTRAPARDEWMATPLPALAGASL